jgi:DNA invertase Pin-like site-specific DNA recombinase
MDGYARVSTEQQDLTFQRNGLHAPGVGDAIYVDHGLSSTNRDRAGLQPGLAACRAGGTLVVTNLDRLARSLLDACDILDQLTKRNVNSADDAPQTRAPDSRRLNSRSDRSGRAAAVQRSRHGRGI